MRPTIGLLVALLGGLLMLTASCSGEAVTDGGKSISDPVSVVRIRQGEKVGGGCVFGEDISQYPAPYHANLENCLQAVGIGPLGVDELEQMRRDVPSFWEKSFPYQQVLLGEWVDGECRFDSPGARALMAVSETVSTDWTVCQRTVNLGPVTEKQVEEIERLGGDSATDIPVPAENDHR